MYNVYFSIISIYKYTFVCVGERGKGLIYINQDNYEDINLNLEGPI